MAHNSTRYNSKLTAEQKQERKMLKKYYEDFGLKFYRFPELGVIIAALSLDQSPEGHSMDFGLAVMSEKEKKYRRKVGEYYAMKKLEDGGDFIFSLDPALWAEKKARRASRLVVDME